MVDLHAIATALTGGGRGILAADESIGTMSARLEAEGIRGTELNRRDYREMLITAPGLSEYVSGVILSDETFGQQLSDGRAVPQACREAGILPGIKVDTGTSELPRMGGALVTGGLDGLGARLADYAARGAAFAKWRAVLDVRTSNPYAVRVNAAALARYAALCQQHGIVPIVEPEVLCVGTHDINPSAATTRDALTALVGELQAARVDLQGIVLKPNFVTPGLDGPYVSAEAVAAVTLDVLRSCVPSDVPGVAFLSGGHSTGQACRFLDAINALDRAPWALSFSFGRALVSGALATWAGSAENVEAAQAVLLDSCRQASDATRRPRVAVAVR
jgi:fructose-bisphosphate aldolase class I